MARPQKRGVDYFPLDVDFVNDRKVRKIMRACNAKGFTILIHLLCQIYRENGYYILWDDELAFEVSETIGNGIQEAGVEELIIKAVDVGFFRLLESDGEKVLTSEGIQRRYKQSTEKRSIDYQSLPYWLLSVETLSTPKTELSTPETELLTPESTQSKGEERKGKKSKEKESREEEEPLDPTHPFYSKYINFRKCITNEAPAVDEMTEPFTFAQFIPLYEFMMNAEKKSEVKRHKIMGEVLREMNNKPELTTKWRSASVTFQKFLTQKLKSLANK